ncbi:MAG: YhfC family glutamic-type intramembrane protease [Anaerofustis sp.]
MTFGTVFTVIVALLAPIGAGIWIAVRHRTYTRALLFGVLTFTVFQILLRIPLLQYVLPKMDWFLIMTSVMPAFTAAFYGVTASLFEEFGRWLVMKLALKQHTSYFDGIAFGVGHGGIEAILLVGINALVLLFYPSALVSSASMFAGGLERIFTIVCHVAWSVMVIKSIREKKPLWLILPLILHAALDTGALLASMAGATVWIIELALAIFAALMLIWLIFEYKKERNSTHETYEEIH